MTASADRENSGGPGAGQNDTAPEGRSDRRAERVVAGAFVASIAGAITLAAVYIAGGQPQLEGVALALALGGLGVAVVAWAKSFMPDDEVTETRPQLPSSDEEVRAFTESFEAGGQTLARRGLLAKLGLGALGALGLAAVFPIRSLGPNPGEGLKRTPFAPGVRLVDAEGAPIRPRELPPASLVTAWPEGHAGDAQSPTLILQIDLDDFVPLPGREGWLVGNIVAYSKLCTHTGCPVGLYQTELDLLLCPCHQSTFDVLHGAEPVFGPAARPLPQLPLAVDDEGFLIATGDFSAPVGGGFWDRGRS
ncbi:MAG TPA: Rieske 2Fe-2S domain-containing protein [Acidimicrobiales bacterium]|nr:Rieske 2Fe-2S domain-containing protein [Acidimicrobiales bacterium]